MTFIGPIRFLTQEQNDIALTATSMRLLGIYSGIVFFILCMTVLALHLTTDTINQRAQYRTLFQIGTDPQDIVKMVSRQSAVYFFLPCAAALVVALLLILVILTCYYGAAMDMIKKDLKHALANMK